MGAVLNPINWSTSYSFKFRFKPKVFGENIELRYEVCGIGIKSFDIFKTILRLIFIGTVPEIRQRNTERSHYLCLCFFTLPALQRFLIYSTLFTRLDQLFVFD